MRKVKITIEHGDGTSRQQFELDETETYRRADEIHIRTRRGADREVIAIPKSGWEEFVRKCQSQTV